MPCMQCMGMWKLKILCKNKKQFKRFHIFCKLCAKILEILKILLQNSCYQNFLQVSSKVTILKDYLSNSNFMKKLLKYYLISNFTAVTQMADCNL